ncbi:MAG: HutD family protein [Bacilli bacterium]
MNILKVYKNDYIKSKWVGGETSQITIYPNSAQVVNQNFIYRISSATVNIDSKFTKYNNYQRFITTLDNSITLNDTIISPLVPYKFDGDVETNSKGICIDFNLICKKNLECDMQIKKNNFKMLFNSYNHYIIYASEDCRVIINNVEYNILKEDSLLIYEDSFELECIINKGYIIICSIKLDETI